MPKTVAVRVDSMKRHPKYRKYYRASKKFKAHADTGEYRIGDLVLIQETRPLSKEKRWRVTGLVKRASDTGEKDQEEIGSQQL